MRVLQINTRDIHGGGAEAIAWSLFNQYSQAGIDSWLTVSVKKSQNIKVITLSDDQLRSKWNRYWRKLGDRLFNKTNQTRGSWQLKTALYGIGNPRWWRDIQRGYEDFDFPGTWRLLDLLPYPPDIVHCHNLHADYFDFRVLPKLSNQLPTVITVHDMWLFTGHCAYSLDCRRWQTGCGHCPYLSIYPSVARDGTAFNWNRKRNIFLRSKLNIATPSQWMMNQVNQSILSSASCSTQVIPNGVNLSVFKQAHKLIVRGKLVLPLNSKILLFVASSIRHTFWKDFQTMRSVVTKLAEDNPKDDLLFVALGDDSHSEHIGNATIRFIPYQKNSAVVAQYYQAADIYLHAARVDNFPTTVLEALACGTPVVATTVGGIPEQIKSLAIAEMGLSGVSTDQATGVLVPPQDADTMALAIEHLLNNPERLAQLGRNAAEDAKKRFDLNIQVSAYLNWYQEIIRDWRQNNIAG